MMVLLILLFAACGIPAGIHAAESSQVDGPVLNVVTEETIHQVLADYVLQQLAGKVEEGERLVVHPRWQGDYLLEQSGAVDFQVMPLSARPLRGPTMLRLELLVNGVTEKALTVTVDVRYYRHVLVTTRSVRRGSFFSDDGALKLAERDVTSARHGFFTELAELEGLRTRRPIGFGDVVSRRHVEEIPVVERGNDVQITVTSAHMQVSAAGVALQDGSVGDRIRVKNVDSGRILYGEVVDANTVRLNVEG